MRESGLYKEYKDILKRKSKIDVLEYNNLFQRIEEIVRDDDDDLPFKD